MRPNMIPTKRDKFVSGFIRQRRRAAEIGTVGSAACGWQRYVMFPLAVGATPALFSFVLLAPSYAVAAENEEIAVLKRMLGELKAQNNKLSQRLSALESASAA